MLSRTKAGVFTLIAFSVISCQASGTLGNPPTTVVMLPDLGPAPDQIPANPLRIVSMDPGLPVVDEAHGEFLANLAGYIAGSGRVDAVYPGIGGDLFILLWRSRDRHVGVTSCRAVAPPDALPQSWSCGGTRDDVPFTIDGMSYSAVPGSQEVLVEHSPDAKATVIELTDRSSFVIRPGSASVSYHSWDGPRPIRITVFWNNGTSTSEVLSP